MRKRSAAAILTSPVFTGAVVALLVNDHVLKTSHPGWLTGKLSDVAGLVVVALLLRVIVRHDGAALGAAAVGFVWLKVVPGAALVAAPVLGGPTRQDPTDMLALLVFVPLAAWLRAGSGPEARATPMLSAVSVVTVVLALSAATATSCEEDETGVTHLSAVDGEVWAGIDRSVFVAGDFDRFTEWTVSRDGGRTFVASDVGPPHTAVAAAQQACDDAGTCWRVEPYQRVEVSAGDTWSTAFEFSDEQWGQMQLAAGSTCSDPKTATFESLLIDRESGVVLVAMGTQGVLRFDGERWDRVAVLEYEPAPTKGPRWLALVPLFVLAGLAIGGVGAAAAASLRAQRHVRGRWLAVAAAWFAVAVGGLMAFGVLMFAASEHYPLWAATSIVLAVGLFGLSWWWIRRGSPRSSLPPPSSSLPRPPSGD